MGRVQRLVIHQGERPTVLVRLQSQDVGCDEADAVQVQAVAGLAWTVVR
jgi:hypothetical protein